MRFKVVNYSPLEIRLDTLYIYTGIDFLIYHLAEFSRVVSRSREIFIETFNVSQSFNESINKNFTTSWHHTWKFRKRESLNFSLWENFVKFYITTYLLEFQAVKMHISKILKKLDR